MFDLRFFYLYKHSFHENLTYYLNSLAQGEHFLLICVLIIVFIIVSF